MQQNAHLAVGTPTLYQQTDGFVMPGGAWPAPVYEGRIYKTRGSPWLGRASTPLSSVTDVGPYRSVNVRGELAYTVAGAPGLSRWCGRAF